MDPTKLLEADHRNADDHVLLESAARRFGMWYSRAGNGIGHAVHQQRFGRPGASLLGRTPIPRQRDRWACWR